MRTIKFAAAVMAVFMFYSAAAAQRTEVKISLNEQFFDTLLDAMYQNSAAPEFSLASAEASQKRLYPQDKLGFSSGQGKACPDSIKILRENTSTRTAVRFREGKIFAPVAFTGSYSPPLVGCVEFAGYAESNVDLLFDEKTQKLSGRVRVLDVVLNGTGGMGSSLVARMVQSSIDKKLNPIEIISLDKLSFPLTLQNSAKLRMKAVGVRHEIAAGALNVIITYEFVKA